MHFSDLITHFVAFFRISDFVKHKRRYDKRYWKNNLVFEYLATIWAIRKHLGTFPLVEYLATIWIIGKY